ncbi:MAG: hypothetical protein E6R13_02580, partial [Spirochaetes bacterium]
MAQNFKPLERPKSKALGTSLLTELKHIGKDLGYDIWAVNTASEKLYTEVYGFGLPPTGYPDFMRACIYQDAKNNGIYQNIGTEDSALWAEIGVSGSVTVLDRFLQLVDTPNSYVGSEGYGVRVKLDGTGLEFYELPVPCDICFTQAERDKLASIEYGAEVNDPIVIPDNPCLITANFLEGADGSTTPVPMALRPADSPVVIVDNTVINGEHKGLSNDYKYAIPFNTGTKDTITAVGFVAGLVNSPDGDLFISVMTNVAGVPTSTVISGTKAVSTLVAGLNMITFPSPVTVLTNTDYFLVVGVSGSTQGTVQIKETTTGGVPKVNINDEWLAISSKLTIKVMGYLKTTGDGG